MTSCTNTRLRLGQVITEALLFQHRRDAADDLAGIALHQLPL